MWSHKYKTLISLLVASIAVSIAAQTSYPGCQDLKAGDFRGVTLASLATVSDLYEPVKMAFDMDAQGNVDVFFIDRIDRPQRNGMIRKYDAKTKTVIKIASFVVDKDTTTNYNEGLNGIALDPNFKSNGWIYLKWTEEGKLKVSRYTYKNNVWSPASEAVILEYPIPLDGLSHTGGGLQFDDYGNLWFGIGDYHVDDEGPSNTSDLRGKILRITPMPIAEGSYNPGVGKSYSIPAGNLGEYWAAKWATAGKSALALQYRDPAVVRPEIFVMGNRNPYTISLDPVRSWVAWGECGPDLGKVTEEDNIATYPGNFGWPYWAGNQYATRGYGSTDGGANPFAPINVHPQNKGARDLPPAIPGTYSYQQSCAMTGPIYRYNPKNPNPYKMPPHFHRKWFVTDFNASWIDMIPVNEDGTVNLTAKLRVTGAASSLFNGINSSKMLDFQAGPDGAFYFGNYGGWRSVTNTTSIVRVEYIGPPCQASTNHVFEKVGCTIKTDPNYDVSATHLNAAACAANTSILQKTQVPFASYQKGMLNLFKGEKYTIEFVTLDGKIRSIHHVMGPTSFSQEAIMRLAGGKGLGLLRVTLDKQSIIYRTVLISMSKR